MKKHLILYLGLGFAQGCGENDNVFSSITTKSGDDYYLSEAAKNIDDKQYSLAGENLEKVRSDSNDKRFLQVAQTLGGSGLSLWDILLNILSTPNSGSSGGLDYFLGSLSDSVFGTDEIRKSRLSAMSSAISLMKESPEANTRTANLSCLLAGFLAVPRINDATTALNAAQTSLKTIAESSSSNSCPDLGNFTQAMESLTQIANDFSLILASVSGCTFIDTSSAESGLNVIEKQLKKIRSKADQGCSQTQNCTGTACQALEVGCVKTIVQDSTAIANDGVINACEYIQNCLDPTQCFGI